MTNTIWAHDLHRHILERLKRRNLGKCFSSCDRTFPLSPFRVRREIQKQDLDSRRHILEDPARRNLGNCWRRRQNFSLLPSRRCCRISLDRGTWVLHGPSSKKVGKHWRALEGKAYFCQESKPESDVPDVTDWIVEIPIVFLLQSWEPLTQKAFSTT